ncbi:MAG: hypothetical protein VW496_03490 [Pelagibacteraceae bacterium]
MTDNISLDALAEDIKQAEQHVFDLKKQYHELRYADLQVALAARNEAEERVRQVTKDLGYRSILNFPATTYYWRSIK